MKNFLIKSFIFFFTIILFFFVKFWYLKVENSINPSILDKNTNISFVFYGDSHFERGIPEFQGSKNLAKSAQPLYFTCQQIVNTAEYYPNATIVVNFDNLTLNHLKKIESEDTYFYMKYFLHFSWKDHFYLFRANFRNWVAVGFGIGLNKSPKLMDEIGFTPLESNYFHKATNRLSLTSDTDFFFDINFLKLETTIASNRNRTFVLVRTPLLRYQVDKFTLLQSEKYYKKVLGRILDKNRNVRFIDHADIFRERKDFFYDWDHLNGIGASQYMPILVDALENPK